MANTIKTTLLLGLLTGLIMGLGNYLGGSDGLVIAFVMAVVMNFGSFWFSDKIVLRMYRARPVEEAEAPDLHRTMRRLVERAGLPMPKLYILPGDAPNAFATGRNPEHAAVAVTEGLLRLMRPEELEGVLAHELAHVKNRDTLISTVAATLAGVIMMLANMMRWAAIFGGGQRDERNGGGLAQLLVFTVVAPLAAMMIQFAISRSREFQADQTGARIAGTPLGLASALEKLGVASQRIPMQAAPATAHMFIVSPLSRAGVARFFSTHPPLEERVRRLRSLTSF